MQFFSEFANKTVHFGTPTTDTVTSFVFEMVPYFVAFSSIAYHQYTTIRLFHFNQNYGF